MTELVVEMDTMKKPWKSCNKFYRLVNENTKNSNLLDSTLNNFLTTPSKSAKNNMYTKLIQSTFQNNDVPTKNLLQRLWKFKNLEDFVEACSTPLYIVDQTLQRK